MKPSPYQIAAFTHAARERSFSKAAFVLGVTQSSVTQHVAKLERIVGTQLFVRRREGLELTRAARELFAISDRLRNLEQLIEEKIEDYGELTTGHLRIIANAPRPAMPVIARYQTIYPHVQIEFTLFDWDTAMRQLREREVDIAIIVEPEVAEGLELREVGTTRYKAFVRHDHPLAGRASLSLRELTDQVVVLPEDGSLTQRVVNGKLRDLGLAFSRLIKTTTFPVVKEAILHGFGVGFMLADSQFPSTHLVAIDIEEMPETYRVCLATPSDKWDLRLVKSFCDVALQVTEEAGSAVTPGSRAANLGGAT